jgi:triacylglycerol lipase
VATYVSHPEFYPGGKSGLRGAIMTSGTYQMSATDKPNVYFGAPDTLVERSAQAGLLATKIPLFFTTAELDPPAMVSSAQALNKALCDANKCPAYFAVLKDHSHMSESFHVNTADHTLTDPLLAFIKAH